MRGFKAFAAAQDTLVGMARMHMMQQRQRVGEEGDEGLPAAAWVSSLAASSSPQSGVTALAHLLSKICDTTSAGAVDGQSGHECIAPYGRGYSHHRSSRGNAQGPRQGGTGWSA